MTERNGKPTVMIVDDEEMVTISLKNLFRLHADYTLLTYTSPTEALECGRETSVDLIISDYMMPGMDGISFLGKFKEIQPQAIRILLTGYSDKDSAVRAINEVGLFQFIEKPWDNDFVRMVVRNGLEKRNLMRTIDEKIRELADANSSLESIQTDLIKAFM